MNYERGSHGCVTRAVVRFSGRTINLFVCLMVIVGCTAPDSPRAISARFLGKVYANHGGLTDPTMGYSAVMTVGSTYYDNNCMHWEAGSERQVFCFALVEGVAYAAHRAGDDIQAAHFWAMANANEEAVLRRELACNDIMLPRIALPDGRSAGANVPFIEGYYVVLRRANLPGAKQYFGIAYICALLEETYDYRTQQDEMVFPLHNLDEFYRGAEHFYGHGQADMTKRFVIEVLQPMRKAIPEQTGHYYDARVVIVRNGIAYARLNMFPAYLVEPLETMLRYYQEKAISNRE
jgi:hypothetical protein